MTLQSTGCDGFDLQKIDHESYSCLKHDSTTIIIIIIVETMFSFTLISSIMLYIYIYIYIFFFSLFSVYHCIITPPPSSCSFKSVLALLKFLSLNFTRYFCPTVLCSFYSFFHLCINKLVFKKKIRNREVQFTLLYIHTLVVN